MRRGEGDGIKPCIGEGTAEPRCGAKRVLDTEARFASLGDTSVKGRCGNIGRADEGRSLFKKDARTFGLDEVCQPRADGDVADSEDGYLLRGDGECRNAA